MKPKPKFKKLDKREVKIALKSFLYTLGLLIFAMLVCVVILRFF